MKRSRRCLVGVGMFALLTAAGCTALPDVSPFVTASADLRTALSRSGAVTLGELRTAGVPAESLERLEGAWRERRAAAKAMVDYSLALQEIADAGNKGKEAAQELGNKLSGLLDSIVPIPANLSGLAVDTFAFVNGQIAKARAAKNLEQALEAATPAVSGIAQILAADLRDMESILIDANQLAVNRINDKYEAERLYRAELVKRRAAVYESTFDVQDPADADLAAAERALKQIDKLLVETKGWNGDYEAELAAARRRGAEGLLLLDATANAVDRWAVAHAKVANALAQRQPVSVDSLLAASVEIHSLIQRTREL